MQSYDMHDVVIHYKLISLNKKLYYKRYKDFPKKRNKIKKKPQFNNNFCADLCIFTQRSNEISSSNYFNNSWKKKR